MGKTHWRTSAAALLVLFAGCRSLDEKPADAYVLQEIAFLNDLAKDAAVESECPVLPAVQRSLVEAGAKLGITVLKPTEGKDNPKRLTVVVRRSAGALAGSGMGAQWVVSEIYATLSVEDDKGKREREVACRAGLGPIPFAPRRACDRLAHCTNDLGSKMMQWLQRTR